MAGSDLSPDPEANLVGAEAFRGYPTPRGEGQRFPAANATGTANEQEAQAHQAQHEALPSGEEDHSKRQPPRERLFLELLELQKRIFQSL
jgi:hypothetical protein